MCLRQPPPLIDECRLPRAGSACGQDLSGEELVVSFADEAMRCSRSPIRLPKAHAEGLVPRNAWASVHRRPEHHRVVGPLN